MIVIRSYPAIRRMKIAQATPAEGYQAKAPK